MKFLVALCMLAAGVSAQYGESGVVLPDGTLRQFTREEADNIAAIGEAGVVMKDGSHIQFDREMAAHHAGTAPAPKPVLEAQGPFGPSGIVMPDGNNRQFTPEQADTIVLIGPSGVIKSYGRHLQLDRDGYPVRTKRSPSQVLYQGPAGVHFKDGQKKHLPVGVEIAVEGPSGAVLTNGDNVQYRKKRSSGAVVGPAGLITPSGRLIQLAPGVSVVSAGPSAALLSTGEGIQYDRKKRAVSKATVGESGIITPGGRLIQLPHGVHIVLEGPSAALLSNGDTVQYEF